MPRIYPTKGADKKANTPSVPMTDEMLQALREAAARADVAVTEQVRRYVQRGLNEEQGK